MGRADRCAAVYKSYKRKDTAGLSSWLLGIWFVVRESSCHPAATELTLVLLHRAASSSVPTSLSRT